MFFVYLKKYNYKYNKYKLSFYYTMINTTNLVLDVNVKAQDNLILFNL